MGEHAHGTIATGAANHRLHARIEPHTHEVLGASLIFATLEASHVSELRIEQHRVSRALQRFDTAHEPAFAWRIRWCDYADRVPLLKRGWTKELRKTVGDFGCHEG